MINIPVENVKVMRSSMTLKNFSFFQISLGWGIAAYSSAMRMIIPHANKGKMSWTGMILQTLWRFGMISARLVALILVSLGLHEWTLVVLCK